MEKDLTNRSRTRITLLIISLLALVLTSVFLSRRTVNEIQEASASIFKDRLVPTAIITKLTSRVYQKRLLLEPYLVSNGQADGGSVGSRLERINRQIDSLLTEFDRTKLTDKEANQLNLLKQRLAAYNQLEEEFTTNIADLPKARQAFVAGTGSTAFNQVAQTLADLSALQLSVGEDLISESRGNANYIYVVTAVQIGLVLIIGVSFFWNRL
ncbi:MCP four helix bundle domain-containing protein [Spirosoma fluminis]